MTAAGSQAESALQQTIRDNKGKYIALVEGSIPTGFDGAYCTIGGRTAIDIAREVCGNAAATVAVGTCAAYGGIPAAAPNPTGALSVADGIEAHPDPRHPQPNHLLGPRETRRHLLAHSKNRASNPTASFRTGWVCERDGVGANRPIRSGNLRTPGRSR